MLPLLYHAHHRRHMEDLPFWLNLARQEGSPLLELGCGSGRLLIPLAQAGFRVVGLDSDTSMLEFIRKNQPLQAQAIPWLVNADMSHFNLAMRFELILVPCNTFSTLSATHRVGCLACVHRHLVADGTFAVSLPNPLVLQSLPRRSENQVEEELVHPTTGNPVQVSSAWKRRKNVFTLAWTYDQLFPDGTIQRLRVESCHYLDPPDSYLAEFERMGFTIDEVYGDYDLSAYASDSPYLIIQSSPRPR
jgi:SAM-dependent methyltransferase